MDYYLLGWIGAIALIVLGFLGNLLPLLPGAPLLIAGFLLGAWLDDFQKVGFGWLTALVILAVLLAVIDFVSGAWGAKKVGASKHAVVGATIGSIVGIFLGLPGLILGPFVGAFLGELMVKPDMTRAGGVGLATWLGMVIGAVLKVGISLMMIAMFAFAYFIA
ncbi:DUF456 domain-containing protein [Chitinimonas lacunae]|uniref:DUF456 domain-containing protein n=1 Tax=Chitinimonas lacunae TaxID=1963018 RepID=A0ABV8MSA8_9NEIS